MAINLSKGQKVNVGDTNITIGLGWDLSQGTLKFDLDASAFILGEDGKLLSDEHFVFYNNKKSPCGGVIHSGDNRTGEGDGDDETITIDINKLNPSATEIIFTVTICEEMSENHNANLGQVKNSYIRAVNSLNGEEILKFELDEEFSVDKSLEIGRLYKKNDVWKFDAIGMGYRENLGFFVSKYSQSPPPEGRGLSREA